jgi:hypothetical protein
MPTTGAGSDDAVRVVMAVSWEFVDAEATSSAPQAITADADRQPIYGTAGGSLGTRLAL